MQQHTDVNNFTNTNCPTLSPPSIALPLVTVSIPRIPTGLDVEQRMKLALHAVLNKGETATCAARKWQLKRTAILSNLLRERKLRRYRNAEAANVPAPRKLFQSKFTSNQLLSAQQEEELANYLKQCYEMQWQHISNNSHHPSTSPKPPLLSEEVARSFTHNFVHMHKLKYPSSWDAKQQAATDWFNGFVDRNPEVIEYVATSTRERKQRKRLSRNHLVKLEIAEAEHEIVSNVGSGHNNMMSEDELDTIKTDNDNNIGGWPPGGREGALVETDLNPVKVQEMQPAEFRIKLEPIEEVDRLEQNSVMELDNINTNMIPEVIYQTETQGELDTKESEDLPSESIAESVKRRTMRKPRILSEHLYAAEMTMEPDRTTIVKQRNQIFSIKKLNPASNPIKIQKVQTFYQPNEEHLNENDTKEPAQEPNPQSPPESDLKESIEKMHSDMNYLLQSVLMEMSENNRLLRRLISTNENIN